MGQAISATQFFVYGKRHFTKTGYLKHVSSYKEPPQLSPCPQPGLETDDDASKKGVVSDSVDMKGKVVVVTGANSGLGKQVATYVASKGATLYMLCRSPDRAETARQDILKTTGTADDKIKIILADVSELAQVRKVVTEISESQVDCVVCNAGVLLNEQKNSSEGLESTFASHLLGGTYLLTTLLQPKLEASSDSRVVVVTSGGMYTTPLPDWSTLTSYTATGDDTTTKPPSFKYDGTMAYAYAKRGQVVLVEEWSKVYDKVKFCTVHPGWTDTPAVEDAFGDKKKYLEPLREPWQGAEGVAWLTACPSADVESGALYLDRQVQKKHISGPFMSEGSFTKNTSEEIQEFMANLKRTAGVE